MSIRWKLRKLRKRITRNLICIDGRFIRFRKVNLEWWQLRENIGDALSPVICEYMLAQKGLSLSSNAKRTCHLMAVGSICGAGQIDATVWGSGIHHQILMDNILRYKNKRKLDIRAVRGPETEKFLNANGINCPKVYGDPAIIMPLVYEPLIRTKKYPISIILHISRKDEVMLPEGVHFIDIESNDYRHFIDEIVASEKVISSSLHGIILAESYGVPAVFLCQGMEDQMMKYKDWYASTGRQDFMYAHNIEEAIYMEPMFIPDLSILIERLMKAFPYDLWI